MHTFSFRFLHWSSSHNGLTYEPTHSQEQEKESDLKRLFHFFTTSLTESVARLVTS